MFLKRLVPGLVMFFVTLSVTAEDFARPAGLEPDIQFWTTIFTRVNSREALIHDNRRLDIVYERIRLPASGDFRDRRKASGKAVKKYRAILQTLAGGKRSNLTRDEQRVLELWGNEASNELFKAASGRVRTQQGLSDGFKKGLQRSTRWEDYILSSLEAAGVPEDLAALPHVESSYNPEARSHVGASGLWQFTRSTGRRFMRIDHVVDERRDPFKSSDAAAALLKYNYSILKSWPLAITAYNHGVAGMRRAVRETGTDDIETIVRQYKGRYFGFASRNFYVAFLAARDVVNSANVYFDAIDWDPPDDSVSVTLNDYIPVEALADNFDVSRRTLMRHNPALLDSVWTGLKYVPKGYDLRLPSEELLAPAAQLLTAVPQDQRFRRQTPDLEHKVRRGESLSVIAVRYDTTVSELMSVNNLKSRHRIRAGQVLNLPYKGAAGQAPISAGTRTYKVRAGDTLGRIAQRSGVPKQDLIAMNDLTNGDRIYVGQTLQLVAERPQVIAATNEAAPPAETLTAVMAVAADTQSEEPAAVDGQQDAATESVAAETTQEVIATDVAASAEQGADAQMLADPSDYLVAADGTIEIQAEETLGHFASWLNIRTQKLRDLNGYSFGTPAVIGRHLKLDFTRVTPEQFSAKRIAYHRELQETFFTRYRIADTTVHEFRRGDSLFVLSLQKYKVPVWLLRQYNPDLDLDRIRPGTPIVIPQIERVERDSEQLPRTAEA